MPTIELCHEQLDKIVLDELRRHLEYTYDKTSDIHPDDKVYRKKLRKHLKTIVEYFGGDPDEFE